MHIHILVFIQSVFILFFFKFSICDVWIYVLGGIREDFVSGWFSSFYVKTDIIINKVFLSQRYLKYIEKKRTLYNPSYSLIWFLYKKKEKRNTKIKEGTNSNKNTGIFINLCSIWADGGLKASALKYITQFRANLFVIKTANHYICK